MAEVKEMFDWVSPSKRDSTITIEMRGRPVTHDEALASAHRLINSHFHNPDSARVSIPVKASDDDVVVTDYIREQKARDEHR